MPPNKSMSQQPRTALLLIDIQEGFLEPTFSHWGPSRSNPAFEKNANSLIKQYRELSAKSSRHKIFHVQHSSIPSRWPSSPLRPTEAGFKFQSFATPKDGERVIVKHVNSGFIGTNLEEVLREHFAGTPGKLFIAGLTTDHCVSTTTRMAGNLGVCDSPDGEKGEVILIGDATAAWAKGEGEEWANAEMVHKVHIQSLHDEFAAVKRTEDVNELWRVWVSED